MNENKEIEEMAKDMAGCEKTCDECFAEYEKLFTQPIQNRSNHCQAIEYCTKLYNAGYRNVKDKVVLDKEEYIENDRLMKLLEEKRLDELKSIHKIFDKVRQETIKEIIDKVDDMIGGKMIAQALKEIYEVAVK